MLIFATGRKQTMKRMCTAAFLALWLALTGGAAAQEASYADGIYRGFYYDGGIEQIAIQFELQDGVFQSVVYRGVKYKDGDYMSDDASDAQKAALRQYRELAAYLVGKGVDAIDDLYAPYGIVEDIDAVTTATMQSSKLISALWDGLNRRPFKLLSTAKLPAAGDFADGVYRGSYMEDGEEEVAVEFTLENNVFSDVRYRALSYHGVDYLSPDAPEDAKRVAGQFEALLAHLQGQPVDAVNDLYQPGDIAPDVDGFSGATLRAPKVISAIWDALNRHAWHVE